MKAHDNVRNEEGRNQVKKGSKNVGLHAFDNGECKVDL